MTIQCLLRPSAAATGSMLDGSVWLLSGTFSVGLRYQQRTTTLGSTVVSHNKVQFLSLTFGVID